MSKFLFIKAYGEMMDFIQRYLPDKFYLDPSGTTFRSDIRSQLFREVIGNICAHSDYQSGYAGFIEVFYDRVITLNATRMVPMQKEGDITLDELGQFTKNPLIVRVLTEIRIVEDLGSGKRNIKKYAPLYYSDYQIKIMNGDMFQFSITYQDRGKDVNDEIIDKKTTQKTTQELTDVQISIIEHLRVHSESTRKELTAAFPDMTEDGIKYHLTRLKELGYIARVGGRKQGHWEILI